MGDLMAMGFYVVAIAALLTAFLSAVTLLTQKSRISQIARGWALQMETVGYLTPEAESLLLSELAEAGLTEISLEGTTRTKAAFGERIVLEIRGTLTESSGERRSYEIHETRATIAKYG